MRYMVIYRHKNDNYFGYRPSSRGGIFYASLYLLSCKGRDYDAMIIKVADTTTSDEGGLPVTREELLSTLMSASVAWSIGIMGATMLVWFIIDYRENQQG